ncbi:MAG: TIGR03013 family PEP-CTERM/XrtA system glycosyltransferase [Planctomycetota bacterium]
MLHVLRHYLPIRKALLLISEGLVLAAVIAVTMTAHLWDPGPVVLRGLAEDGRTSGEALLRSILSSILVALVCQASLYLNELYDFRIATSRYDRFARFVSATGLAIVFALVALGLSVLFGSGSLFDFPGLTLSQTVQSLVFATGVAFVVVYWWRRLFTRAIKFLNLAETVLVLGEGELSATVYHELARAGDAGFRVLGVLPKAPGSESRERSDDPLGGAARFQEARAVRSRGQRTGPAAVLASSERPAERAEEAVLESPRSESKDDGPVPQVVALPGETLESLAARLGVDTIVVALTDRRGTLPTTELLRARLAGFTVEEAESLYERVTGKIAVRAMRPSYLIFNRGFASHPFQDAAKRAFDVIAALLLLAVLWPLMIATAIAVRLDSPGPVLFRQERSGRFGRPFVLMKFRSMRSDAESSTGPVWAQKDDPRVTRVGRFLRKSRLDEFPQLFNVLAGHMSMVGPRPERPHFIEQLAQEIPYYHQRHIVKPGVTGWAQINYPYGNTTEDALQKLQYDLFYIKYHSVPFDLSILVGTIKTVLLRRGT